MENLGFYSHAYFRTRQVMEWDLLSYNTIIVINRPSELRQRLAAGGFALLCCYCVPVRLHRNQSYWSLATFWINCPIVNILPGNIRKRPKNRTHSRENIVTLTCYYKLGDEIENSSWWDNLYQYSSRCGSGCFCMTAGENCLLADNIRTRVGLAINLRSHNKQISR